MPEHRPFPPSPRRKLLARHAGLGDASPMLVGAIAWLVAVVAVVLVGRAAAATIGESIAQACAGHAVVGGADLPRAVLELVAPVLAASAFAAVVAHVAQTRALWSPRRRVVGAPVLDRGPRQRTMLTLFEQAGAASIGAITFGWLWSEVPRLGGLLGLAGSPSDGTALLAAGGALIASAIAALGATWIGFGALDAVRRRVELAGALAMSPAEKREDDRLAAADPRWRARRAELARGPAIGERIAGAAVVILGDDAAVAIAWDPVRTPIPLRVATGRTAHATQILGLARRYAIAVHRDPALAAALVDGEGPVPDRCWADLAAIVAALRGPTPPSRL